MYIRINNRVLDTTHPEAKDKNTTNPTKTNTITKWVENSLIQIDG